MKKITLVLMLLVLVAGCTLLKGGQKGTNTPIAKDYRTGTGGLVIETLEGLPAKEIYEGSNFIVGLRLKNTGAYNIKRGAIEVVGFDEKYVALEKQKSDLNAIEGKSITNPQGGFYIEEFKGKTLKSLAGAKEYLATYYVVATYDYRTEAQTQVCVNTNLYSDLKLTQESCKPETVINLDGQGAPVAVTKIEQIITPDGMRYRLFVENKGKGELFGPIYMEEAKLANRRLNCEPRFLEFKKENKENVFVCTLAESGATAYVTPFYAALYYTYQLKEKKQFKIKGW